MSSKEKKKKGKKKGKKKITYPLVYNGQDEFDLAQKAEFEVRKCVEFMTVDNSPVNF